MVSSTTLDQFLLHNDKNTKRKTSAFGSCSHLPLPLCFLCNSTKPNSLDRKGRKGRRLGSWHQPLRAPGIVSTWKFWRLDSVEPGGSTWPPGLFSGICGWRWKKDEEGQSGDAGCDIELRLHSMVTIGPALEEEYMALIHSGHTAFWIRDSSQWIAVVDFWRDVRPRNLTCPTHPNKIWSPVTTCYHNNNYRYYFHRHLLLHKSSGRPI